MANTRIKDLPDITPVDATYVPGDSTSTATGKATIGAWVLAGIKSALAALSGAVTAAGDWTFSGSGTVFANGATFGDDISAVSINMGGALDNANAGEATRFQDPTAAQSLATKAYTDARVVAAVFSNTGTLQFTTSSALFTGNATVSDTSLYAIPFAGAAGTYYPVATPITDNANFATATLDAAPTALRVRVWKHDGTKEARDFCVVVRR